MTKLTINDAPADTPSAQIIKAANKTATATDTQGRVLTIRRMTALAKMRLFALAGPELSKNEQWVGLAALASSVTHLNGDMVTTNSVREIEFLVDRLDDDGLNAVGEAYTKAFGVAAKDDVADVIKN